MIFKTKQLCGTMSPVSPPPVSNCSTDENFHSYGGRWMSDLALIHCRKGVSSGVALTAASDAHWILDELSSPIHGKASGLH